MHAATVHMGQTAKALLMRKNRMMNTDVDHKNGFIKNNP
ncbi:hypothetical protein LDG_6659 [Legionella drancourtii LLAP12]|uniref:Uncharacterized protein n=1 Tax=Legionella drancourtii LLAP12 TaxID=658187 RepID=G9EN38_9GAMM|nr:hypothetical protein LDG_6659 [Legionella drancourtii LLAP12]